MFESIGVLGKLILALAVIAIVFLLIWMFLSPSHGSLPAIFQNLWSQKLLLPENLS